MAKGKLILICQSGGKFVTKGDSTLSYEGGEANAVNIIHETVFDDLKLKVAEMCNLNQKTISVKYFLPGNRRNLISLRNDKDLKRMIDFHANSVTADIFVDGEVGFDHDAIKLQASRNSALKLAETVNHITAPTTAATPVVNNRKDGADPRVHAHAGSKAAARKVVDSSSPGETYTASPQSSEHGTDSDSEYKPRVAVSVDADQDLSDLDMTCGPADTVKRRRRTASWTMGARGPTIVAVSDSDRERRRRKKNNQSREHETDDDILGIDDLGNPSSPGFSDDDLPEKLVASWRDCITGVGQDFKSVKEFREALQKYAIAHRFVYKLKKNDSNRASGICVEEGCTWSIHASWVPASLLFRIKKLNDTHTCGGESWKNAHPAKKLLVSVIKDRLRDSPHDKPREIARSISRDFGIELKYTQVRRGIEGAREQLQGSYKESYSRLPWFCEKLEETNPGSFVKLLTDDEKRFQCLFVSFLSCVQSFEKNCRPILFLNATSLKSKYHESLLTATAVDADDGFFPVAFSIVNNENEDNWHWFLEQLKSALSSSVPLTFVSDRDKGLEKAVHEIFENAHHGYSMYHLIESFKRNLKGPFQGEGRGVLPGKFLSAAHALRQSVFKKFTEQIKQISPSAYDWVTQVEPEHWTSLSFRGEQYNYIIQNVAEPYTKLMDEIKESTLMQKIEALIYMISEVINTRRISSSNWTAKLTPSKEKMVQGEALKAHRLRLFISSDVLFEVHDESTHVVNIEKLECTCLEWKGTSGIPCRHAIAALNSSGKGVYDYCSKYFTVESYQLTYRESINPIPGIGLPLVKEDAESDDVKVLPPAPRPASEQKKEQSKIEDPDKRTVTCSKCKEPGHNKASCKATS
ncbi:hypothetical protein ABFX02_04G179850 [Erythranthe guttata]|nr:PREDICTED: uncharacterized protein LOC105950448 isoform X2 [Erythranthe guttata]XP_012829259.1 PREDICTED: uncharacterized protein LOC105950448 isoform X2 [Erythranthe guttata]XP_012829260.1 PREDICTED: uncharacterized protein LOC105950448 isoform X2 [Erythranthe guttata]|eukprot:XP_012829258.1 PREDICTED: uncharacterized protein LOC105950448 isoform X2 [Erythranthe guttata]